MGRAEEIRGNINRGDYYRKNHDHEKAIKFYKDCIVINPKFMHAWDNIVSTLSDMGGHDEALEYSKQQLQVNPKYALGWNNIGYVYYRLKKYSLAIEACERAIRLDKTMKIAYITLMDVYLRLGDYDKAREIRLKAKPLKHYLGKTKKLNAKSRADFKGTFIIGILLIVGSIFLFWFVEDVWPGIKTAGELYWIAVVILLIGILIVALFIFAPSWIEVVELIFKAVSGDYSVDTSHGVAAASLEIKKDTELKTVEVAQSPKVVEVEGRIKEITEKALLIAFSSKKEVWIPKTVIHSDYLKEIGINQQFEIDSWVIKKHSIELTPKDSMDKLDLLKKMLQRPKVVDEIVEKDILPPKRLEEGTKFCFNCGRKLEIPEIICKNCGTSMVENE